MIVCDKVVTSYLVVCTQLKWCGPVCMPLLCGPVEKSPVVETGKHMMTLFCGPVDITLVCGPVSIC